VFFVYDYETKSLKWQETKPTQLYALLALCDFVETIPNFNALIIVVFRMKKQLLYSKYALETPTN
jgi:hypothetical protein